MNLPNLLTMLRMLLVPFFMVAMLMNTPSSRWIALIIFAVASITDTLDGYLARRNNQVTNFGKLMDPLADKILTASAMICMVQLGDIAAWLVVIVLFREYAITGLRSVAAAENIVVPANMWGKCKTVCQMIALLLLIIQDSMIAIVGINIGLYVFYLAVILTVYSGLVYFVAISKKISWS